MIKLISLKFEIFFVMLFLGNRTMKEALVLWLIIPLRWNSTNTLTKSSLITSQQSWNSAMVKQLGPGVLSLSNWKIALEISSSVKDALFSDIGLNLQLSKTLQWDSRRAFQSKVKSPLWCSRSYSTLSLFAFSQLLDLISYCLNYNNLLPSI